MRICLWPNALRNQQRQQQQQQNCSPTLTMATSWHWWMCFSQTLCVHLFSSNLPVDNIFSLPYKCNYFLFLLLLLFAFVTWRIFYLVNFGFLAKFAIKTEIEEEDNSMAKCNVCLYSLFEVLYAGSILFFHILNHSFSEVQIGCFFLLQEKYFFLHVLHLS